MKMKKTRGIIYLQLILSTFFLTVLDQWTKHLAVTHLQNQSDISLIDGVLSLHYLENRGAAFGVFQNRQGAFFILTVVILAFICVMENASYEEIFAGSYSLFFPDVRSSWKFNRPNPS